MASSFGISATVFDLDGTLFVQRPLEDASQRNRRATRRVSRTATLDGGCAYYDTGFAQADRDIMVELARAAADDIERAAYLVKTYGELMVCCDQGAFLCAPSGYQVNDGTLRMDFHVIEKRDEE